MKRRHFIQALAVTGSALWVNPALGFSGFQSAKPEFVEAFGPKVDDLYSLSLEAMGGLLAFAPRGVKVLIKPSMHVVPQAGMVATSSPALIRRVVEHCAEIRASRVTILDRTLDDWMQAYDQTGVERAAKDGGAKVLQANNENFYKPWPGMNGVWKLHEAYLEADVVINVAVAHHDRAGVYSGCIRNLSGVVWQRPQMGADYELLARLFKFKKPTLNVVECGQESAPLFVSADVLAIENRVQNFLNLTDGVSDEVFDMFEKQSLGTRHYRTLRYQKIES